MCYSVVWARYGRDLGQINPLKPWDHTENVVWARYGRDLGAIYVYCVLLRCLGSIWGRLALGMFPLMENMCYSVVWARYGRDLGKINPLQPWGHTETKVEGFAIRALECPFSRLLCVIPLFGLDMGGTWAKSILSRLQGGNPWGRTEAKVSSPGMSPLTANMLFRCLGSIWARLGPNQSPQAMGSH